MNCPYCGAKTTPMQVAKYGGCYLCAGGVGEQVSDNMADESSSSLYEMPEVVKEAFGPNSGEIMEDTVKQNYPSIEDAANKSGPHYLSMKVNDEVSAFIEMYGDERKYEFIEASPEQREIIRQTTPTLEEQKERWMYEDRPMTIRALQEDDSNYEKTERLKELEDTIYRQQDAFDALEEGDLEKYLKATISDTEDLNEYEKAIGVKTDEELLKEAYASSDVDLIDAIEHENKYYEHLKAQENANRLKTHFENTSSATQMQIPSVQDIKPSKTRQSRPSAHIQNMSEYDTIKQRVKNKTPKFRLPRAQ